MRGSNVQRQYYNDLSHSRYSSKTSRKLKSQSEFNDTKTRFLARVEKACTTLSSGDMAKEVGLYRKEIERLEKECLKKDKMILQSKSTRAMNKELEAELVEAYRVIYMYEGKISQYEKELKRIELFAAKTASGILTQKIEQLLQSYREDNAKLMGSLEQSNRIIFELEQKLKKVQNKYFTIAWKLSSAKRQDADPLKKRFPNLRNTITIKQAPLLQKQKMLRMNMKEESKKKSDQYQQLTTNMMISDKVDFSKGGKGGGKIGEGIGERMIQTITVQKKQERPKESTRQGTVFAISSNDFGGERRESPLSERKVYMSPITRYELNRKVEEVSKMMDSPHKLRLSAVNQPNSNSNSRAHTIYY